MPDTPILPDDEPVSLPSQRTMPGRKTPRGERLRAGDVLLGRYTVLSELGEGGMGVVYKCLDSVGGIEVALKCLPPELSRNEAEMEGIRENYAIVAKLHHSAISGLRNLEKDPDFGEYYLVMDLAEGEDLSQVLRRRSSAPMPLAEALAILCPLAAALDYAHAEKVLHRDVKPANVKALPAATSGGAPRVQLLDFGLAAEVRSSLSRVSRKGYLGSSGTPSYMAPEQWEARPQGPATDQYALAVVAYQMLAGVRPFDADDPDVLRRAVLSRDPDPVPGLSRGTNAALRRALAKDPAARFPSCTAFIEALRLARSARPTRSRLAIAAAALVAVAVGALWFTQSRGRTGGAEETGGPIRGKTPHAESAEPSAGASSLSESPAPSFSLSSPSPPVPVLPPDDAPLEELQAARGRFADALRARRAEDWPDTTAESAALLSSVSALDDRIAAALEAREKADRDEEAARLAKLEEDAKNAARAAVKAAKDEESIRVLRAGAERDAKKAEPFRKWAGEGEFKTRFATLDGRKKELDRCSKAADLAKAQGAAAEVRVAADWIADNAAVREEFDELEKSVDALSPGLEEAEASRYAKSALYRAKTARDEAVRLRDRSDFAGAKEKLESAKAQYEGALASAKTARAAAKAKEALVEAEAAKIREDWSAAVAAAEKAQEWEPDNADAKALKKEAAAELKKITAVKAEAERKAREAEERRLADEEAARKAEEERLARKEAERKARGKAERLAREEADRLAREAAERKRAEEEAANRKAMPSETAASIAVNWCGLPQMQGVLRDGDKVDWGFANFVAFGPGWAFTAQDYALKEGKKGTVEDPALGRGLLFTGKIWAGSRGLGIREEFYDVSKGGPAKARVRWTISALDGNPMQLERAYVRFPLALADFAGGTVAGKPLPTDYEKEWIGIDDNGSLEFVSKDGNKILRLAVAKGDPVVWDGRKDKLDRFELRVNFPDAKIATSSTVEFDFSGAFLNSFKRNVGIVNLNVQ